MGNVEVLIGWDEVRRYAFIESASLLGLNMWLNSGVAFIDRTSSDLGTLISKVLDIEPNKIIVGLGGSGMHDWGIGMASVLGVDFYDHNGEPLHGAFANRADHLARVDLKHTDPRLEQCQLAAWTDINAPLTGSVGAALLYARQKGATREQVSMLEYAGLKMVSLAVEQLGYRPDQFIGAGAAGGLGFGFAVFLNASLHSGIEKLMEAMAFEQLLRNAKCVVAGEGRFDHQSLHGKLVGAVAQKAQIHQVPLILLCGGIEEGVALPTMVTKVIALEKYRTSRHEAISEVRQLISNDCADAVFHAFKKL